MFAIKEEQKLELGSTEPDGPDRLPNCMYSKWKLAEVFADGNFLAVKLAMSDCGLQKVKSYQIIA